MNVPLAAGLFQGLIGKHRTFAAGAAHGQLHGQHRHAHDDQKQHIEQHEYAAAVFPGHIGELPHIADADGAPGTHQQEAQTGLERFAFHDSLLQFWAANRTAR